jgi:hypothetical protein
VTIISNIKINNRDIMTTQALSILEHNPLELVSVEAAGAPFLAAALKNISLKHSANTQIHSDKLSSISVRSIEKLDEKMGNIEVSTSGEEIKKEVMPEQAMTVLEKTKKVVVEQGFVQEEASSNGKEIENKTLHFGHEIEVLDEAHEGHETSEKIEELIETLEAPVEFATLGLEWSATGVEILSHHAEALAHGLEKGAASFALVGLVAKVDKIHKTVLEVKADEEIQPSKLVALGFSIVEVLSSGLNFLSKMGVISHAMAALGRFNLIAAFCTCVIAMVNLGDSITNYKDVTSLFKALVTLVADAAMLGLIYYAGAHVGVLLLILGTGIFLLNVAIPDEEHHAVKTAH